MEVESSDDQEDHGLDRGEARESSGTPALGSHTGAGGAGVRSPLFLFEKGRGQVFQTSNLFAQRSLGGSDPGALPRASPCRLSRQRPENPNRYCRHRRTPRGVTHDSNPTPGSRAAPPPKVTKRLRPRCAARAVSRQSAKSASGCCAQT